MSTYISIDGRMDGYRQRSRCVCVYKRETETYTYGIAFQRLSFLHRETGDLSINKVSFCSLSMIRKSIDARTHTHTHACTHGDDSKDLYFDAQLIDRHASDDRSIKICVACDFYLNSSKRNKQMQEMIIVQCDEKIRSLS